MVSTRGHPKQFPEPTASPTKRSVTPSPDANNGALTAPTPRRTRSTKSSGWSHTPSNLALIWLSISLPLVIWDTGFVLLRPHTFPGGKLHWPLWVPYELYAKVDGVYGIKAWQEGLGFTAAQGTLNAIETVGYLTYLWIVWSKGQQERVEGRGAPKPSKAGWLGMARTVRGRDAGIACLLGFTFTIMTFSKTLLYFMNEAWSGFEGVRHNDWPTLVFLYILPNTPWIYVPLYLSYVFGSEILEGLAIAAGAEKKSL